MIFMKQLSSQKFMMGKSTHSLWQLLLLACSTSAANYQEYLQGKTFVFYYLWYAHQR